MPLVASLLIGVGVKVGIGLAASAAKKLMEPAATAPDAASFPSLLTARSRTAGVSAADGPPAIGPAQPLARLPYDMPGRLAAERLHGLALDVQAQRGVPGPVLTASRGVDGPLAAYRRLQLEGVRVGVLGT